jgi:hypothetical protein
MAWANSYLASATFKDTLNKVIAPNIGGSSPDTIDIALFNNSVVPNIDTASQAYNVAPWNANEVNNGGGNWPAGGVALATPTLAIYSTVGIQYYAGNVNVSSVTLTGFFGALVYDSTTSNRAIAAVYFGGSYTVTSGTIGITWQTVNSQTTIWYIQLH